MTQVLKEYFPQCFDKNGDLMPQKLQEAILDLAQENNAQTNTATQDLENEAAFSLSKESYSLNWLGKSYAKLLRHLPTHTLIAQDSAHNAQPQNANSKNVLIKGDNLEVLKHLKNAYYRKVKMIYIDPPYNTGNGDFIYNDERSFTPQSLAQMANIELEEAGSILNLTLKNSSTHSAWLSFMYPRLYIARQLLRDDGVIFISIDDNEQANLKLLCDEIFGEENFVACAVWHKKDNASFLGKDIIDLVEYVLIYKKSVSFNGTRDCLIDIEKHRELITKPSKIGERIFKKDCCLIENGDFTGLLEKGLYGSKQFCMEILEDVEIICGIPKNDIKIKGRFCWTQSSLDNETLKGGRIEIKSIKGMKPIFYKNFDDNIPYRPMRNLLSKKIENDVATNNDAANEIKEIFDNLPLFEYPKPSKLIKKFIRNITNTNSSDIVLDFFAGSGTTAQAVMELNAEDKGNREFILVQLDEVIDKSKSKTAYEFCKNELGSENPTIFDITKERIKRASAKISNCHTERSEVSQNSNNRDSSLRASHSAQNDKVLDSLITTQPKNDKDLGFKIYELRENDFDSQNGALFKEVDKNALLESFRLQDSTPLSVENQTIDLGGYKAIRAGEKLYLLNSGFEMKHLQKLISLIDAQKDFVIKEISYLNDAFESARIREIEEGIKSYSNKKGLKILVRARFA